MDNSDDYAYTNKRRRVDGKVLNSNLNEKSIDTSKKQPVKFLNYFKENFNDIKSHPDETNLSDSTVAAELESIVDSVFTKTNNKTIDLSLSSQNNCNKNESLDDLKSSKDLDMVISSVVDQIMGKSIGFSNSFQNDFKIDSSLDEIEKESFEFINDFSDPKNDKFDPKMKDVETLIHEDFVDLYKYFKENYDNFNNLIQEKYKNLDEKSFQRSVITSMLKYYFSKNSELTSSPENLISFVYDHIKEDQSLVCCDLELLNYRYYLEILYAMVDEKSFFRCVDYKDVVEKGEKGEKVKFRRGFLDHMTETMKKRYNYQDGSYSLFYMDGLDFPGFRKLPVKVKKNMTLKDIPKASRTGVKKRFNSTIQLFSLIIIFRTTCPKFEELNGNDPAISTKNPNDCDPWHFFL